MSELELKNNELKKIIDEQRSKSDNLPSKDENKKIIEKSNVNAVEEMVNTIDQQRKFEMHVKMIQMTEELDSVGASLMRLPGM